MGMSDYGRCKPSFIVNADSKAALGRCSIDKADWLVSGCVSSFAPTGSLAPSASADAQVLLHLPSGRRFLVTFGQGMDDRAWIDPCDPAFSSAPCTRALNSRAHGMLVDAIERANFK